MIQLDAQPKAHPESIFEAGCYRLTFLTPRLLRIEYAADRHFEDRRTLKVLNRRLDPVKFSVREESGEYVLATDFLEINLIPDGQPVSETNLSVKFSCVKFNLGGSKTTWYPGKKDPLNCLGTARTLDRCDGSRFYPQWFEKRYEELEIERGLISRSGWAEIDDSGSVVLDDSSGRLWPAARPEGIRQDIYLLAYDLDFKGALADAAKILGAQPLPPRYALGYWWCRYWAYLDKELETIILDCEQQEVPLDVLVIDMDWHRQGWTGFSWEDAYFPDPDEFLSWARARGIHVSMNLHPAEGFGPHEDCYAEACKIVGWNPKEGKTIPFDVTNPACMEAYFNLALKHYEDLGVDFWWLDWQQGTESALAGLDPLPWLNELHFEHGRQQRTGHRPLCFSRYGGLGAGRYPVGFSGDTHVTWDSLAFQPLFTARAANALFGYWSHDIGGHYQASVSGELYVRWMQFGCFSPILRTHATKHSTNDRQFWEFGLPYSRVMKETVRTRYEWIPYMYTAARQCVDSAISICRPMYYEQPHEDLAYKYTKQYMFGDDVVFAPVVTPIEDDNMSPKEVWLPEGDWFDCFFGDIVVGGRVLKRRYLLEEMPVFVRQGAILPGQFAALRSEPGSYRNLLVTVYPSGNGSGILYEDDGVSIAYLQGEEAWFDFESAGSGQETHFRFRHREGGFQGFLSKRELQIRFPSTVPPEKVLVNGKEVGWAYRRRRDSWSYDSARAMVIVWAGQVDCKAGVEVTLTYAAGVDRTKAYGLPGLLRRLYHAFDAARVIELDWERQIGRMAQTGNRIARNPAAFTKEIDWLTETVQNLPHSFEEVRRKVAAQSYQRKRKLMGFEHAVLILEQLQ